MKSWFKGGSNASKHSLHSSAPTASSSANHAAADHREVEITDLQDAMDGTSRILNDDIEGAEEQLRVRKDSSSFHLLGLGVAIFMRSVLGFEKEIMAEAVSRLAECEAKSWSDMRKAQKLAEVGGGGGGGGGWFKGSGRTDTNGHVSARPSQIYPPGSEFQLVNAEAQLMGAILAVMQESLTEGIKGFYKLRKAFVALDSIMEAESRALASHKGFDAVSAAKRATASDLDLRKARAAEAKYNLDSDIESLNSTGDPEKAGQPGPYRGRMERVNSKSAPGSILEEKIGDLNLDAATAPSPDSRSGSPDSKKPRVPARQTLLERDGPDSAIFTDPVDIFVHSGANMCFGILLLLISMVPPAFSKLMYIVGFKGDRERGVKMLWQSTKFQNVNAGVAGLMLLAYYNGVLAGSEIMPSDEDIRELADEGEIVGYPTEQCSALLQSMSAQYPDSRMWKLEEARNLANLRRLPEAIATLKANSDSKMRQVNALNQFELAVNALFVMDWVTMRDGFLRCIDLNDWSHSMYYYFAGAAEVEMYRDAVQAGDAAEAKKHKAAAVGYFKKCPEVAGRKKFLAKQMPFEVFTLRKIQKWEARAKEFGVDLVDAVSISPAQEMTYLWSGSKRMSEEMLLKALECLSLERCTAGKEKVEKWKALPDEALGQAVAEAAILSSLGRYDEARARVEPFLHMDR